MFIIKFIKTLTKKRNSNYLEKDKTCSLKQ